LAWTWSETPQREGPLRVAVVVAHPDDEILWAGGLLLSRPQWSLAIVTLCRGKDPDRAPRFQRVLACLKAEGAMGDLDDGPEQVPLAPEAVQAAILALLPAGPFDLLITHAPDGEYTWHRRHLEVARGVQCLVDQERLAAGSLWQFAYEDQGGAGLPRPKPDPSLLLPLDAAVWARKYALITEVYGFLPASWEARAAPRTEAFNCFRPDRP
jgi:LmbE family N-acetylglucosaminyl deacetylase